MTDHQESKRRHLEEIEEERDRNSQALEDGLSALLRGARLLTFSEKAAIVERTLRALGYQARVIG